MTPSGVGVTAIVVVPEGVAAAPALERALREHVGASSLEVVAVAAGDPHRFDDAAPMPAPVTSWGRLAVALDPDTYVFARTLTAVRRALDSGAQRVLALRAGSVVVAGSPAPLLDALSTSAPVALVPRALRPLSADHLDPGLPELAELGGWSPNVLAAAPGAEPAIEWLLDAIGVGSRLSPGRLLDELTRWFRIGCCTDPSIGAGRWRTPPDDVPADVPAVVDVEGFDPERPWTLAPPARRRARVLLSRSATLRSTLERHADQISPAPRTMRLPGGVEIDEPMRAAMRHALERWALDEGDEPPDPYGPTPSAFWRWLGEPSPRWGAPVGRYWRELYALRPDLQVAFPSLETTGAIGFSQWTRAAWWLDVPSVIVSPPAPSAGTVPADVGRDPGGVNVVGYLQHSTSLGHVGRRLVDCLAAGGVPTSTVASQRTGSPPLAPLPHVDGALRYDTNLVAVNAEQFPVLEADMGTVLLPDRRNVAYWFWELSTPSNEARQVLARDHPWRIDEVWAASSFVADAFRAATDRPVHVVPVPVDVPNASSRDRASFGLPADRAVFLCTFDFLSVVERKNPFGAIEAFTTAFRDGEGPLLLVKSTNGHQRWSGLERLRVAADGRSDVVVWDEHLPQADQMALIREVDCLVSLHRSEGLGLHLAEAMGMGTPVVATAYSGNVDFMDATCAAMVGYELVAVEHGEGVYLEGATWAEPDRDDAARWLRRLAGDAELRDKLARAGRERIASLPGAAAIGELMRTLLGAGAR